MPTKTTLKHLKELHGAIAEISHLANKVSEVSKAEGFKEASETSRRIEKSLKVTAADLEKVMHNLKSF